MHSRAVSDTTFQAATHRSSSLRRPHPGLQRRPAAAPVQVVITAHQTAWVQMSADGKTAFTGTLQAERDERDSGRTNK